MLSENIYWSREKDHTNHFRKINYDNDEQMEAVIGKLEDNAFIKQTAEDLKIFKQKVQDLIKKWDS